MSITGNRGTIGAGGDRAQTNHHPAVSMAGSVKADNGVYPQGLIVKEDADGNLVPYTGTADTPVAVIDEPIDTAADTVAMIVVHGTVRTSELKIKKVGEPATVADIKKLAKIGIYAV